MTDATLILNPDERVLWQGAPAPTVLAVWLFTRVLPFSFFAAFLVFWSFGFFGGMWAVATGQDKEFNPFTLAGGALKVITPLAFFLACAYIWFLRRTYSYSVTTQRIVFVGGLALRKRRSVHYHKVTDVEVSQNFLEQLLKISTLKIFTAGASGIPWWPGWGERAEITCPGIEDARIPEQVINNALRTYRATGE